MSELLSRVIQFHLDTPTGPLVATTISNSQKYIAGFALGLASKYPGREIHTVYPTEHRKPDPA
jgi:hypothetical protein